MNPSRWPTVRLVILISLAALACRTRVQAAPVEAAQGVLGRLIPQAADRFTFEILPSDSGFDVFEVEAAGGRVTVRGSSAVAMCRGAYDYLKRDCHALVTWDGDQLDLPDPLPAAPKRRVASPAKYRQYLHPHAFGYAMPFWDWSRWEREIDWMALHGINFPLSMTGQEKVWRTVFEGYGFTGAELDAFFNGPAFLPWSRQGNVAGHAGPLPPSYIGFQAELQKRILARQRELGMKPVTPGFQGFVPPAFRQRFPAVKAAPAEYAGNWTNLQVDPREPMFAEIQKKIIAEYRREYGETGGYYLIDLYHEMEPAIPAANRTRDVQAVGLKVHQGLQAADPKAVWVTRGWSFVFNRAFWADSVVSAFLDSIPREKLILLDMAADYDKFAAWPRIAPLRKRQIIWTMQLDFGGRTYLHGNLDQLARKPFQAWQVLGGGAGNFAGMGMAPEGGGGNAAAFELMSDLMWLAAPPALPEWLAAFARQRYGTASPKAVAVWNGIHRNFYQRPDEHHENLQPPFQLPPHGNPAPAGDLSTMQDLIKAMLAASEELGGSALFLQDLVDVAKRYFGEKTTGFLLAALPSGPRSAGPARIQARADFNALLEGLDALLATVSGYSLEAWIKTARATVPERDGDVMERNARFLMSPDWFGDYSYRDWSGLTSQYYRERWDRYFTGGGPAVDRFHAEWFAGKALQPAEKVDAVDQVRKLLVLSDSRPPVALAPGRSRGALPRVSITGSTRMVLAVEGEGPWTLDLYSPEGRRLHSLSGRGPGLHPVDSGPLPAGLHLGVFRMQDAVTRLRLPIL